MQQSHLLAILNYGVYRGEEMKKPKKGKVLMDKKLYAAMVRLEEKTYFGLRRLALDRRLSFNRLAHDVLEIYFTNEIRTAAKRGKGETSNVSD